MVDSAPDPYRTAGTSPSTRSLLAGPLPDSLRILAFNSIASIETSSNKRLQATGCRLQASKGERFLQSWRLDPEAGCLNKQRTHRVVVIDTANRLAEKARDGQNG